jgi:hypothetical protein
MSAAGRDPAVSAAVPRQTIPDYRLAAVQEGVFAA